jgi:hypothetical protein
MATGNASLSLQSQGYRTRQGGSTFTVFLWAGQVIGFANQIALVSPTPVAQPAPIQPMDSPYPVEIITPAATTMGTLTLQLTELYNKKVWERLAGLAGTPNLANIFITMASFGLSNQGQGISLAKLISPPPLSGVDPSKGNVPTQIQQNVPAQYGEIYQNVTIVNVEDGETITIGTQQINKNITVAYTNYIPFSSAGVFYQDLASQLAYGGSLGMAPNTVTAQRGVSI